MKLGWTLRVCLRDRERGSQQREHQWQPQWRVESIFVQPPLLGFINRSALFVSCYCPLRLSVLLFPAPSFHLIPTQFHPTPVYFFCRFRNSKDILYFGLFLVRNAAQLHQNFVKSNRCIFLVNMLSLYMLLICLIHYILKFMLSNWLWFAFLSYQLLRNILGENPYFSGTTEIEIQQLC